MAKVVVNKPSRPKGSVVGIPGLGAFENGKEHEVDDARAARYKKAMGLPHNKQLVFGEPLPQPKPKTESSEKKEDN